MLLVFKASPRGRIIPKRNCGIRKEAKMQRRVPQMDSSKKIGNEKTVEKPKEEKCPRRRRKRKEKSQLNSYKHTLRS